MDFASDGVGRLPRDDRGDSGDASFNPRDEPGITYITVLDVHRLRSITNGGKRPSKHIKVASEENQILRCISSVDDFVNSGVNDFRGPVDLGIVTSDYSVGDSGPNLFRPFRCSVLQIVQGGSDEDYDALLIRISERTNVSLDGIGDLLRGDLRLHPFLVFIFIGGSLRSSLNRDRLRMIVSLFVSSGCPSFSAGVTLSA